MWIQHLAYKFWLNPMASSKDEWQSLQCRHRNSELKSNEEQDIRSVGALLELFLHRILPQGSHAWAQNAPTHVTAMFSELSDP